MKHRISKLLPRRRQSTHEPSTRRVSEKPPVVLFGATEMGLAAARSLARRGICVFGIHFRQAKPLAAYSRHVRFVQGPDLDDEQAVLEFLLKFGKGFVEKPVLLPAQDHAVLFMHRHRDVLGERYRFYIWESDLLPKVGSKCELADVARHFDLPVPITLAPRNRDQLEDGIKQLVFPCIVKPEFTNLWWGPAAQALGLSKKAIRVDNPDELRNVYDRSARVGSKVVVQRMVVGADSGHMSYPAFVSPDGEITAEMVARKWRINPAGFGIGCYLESALPNDAVQVGREIIHRLGYRGFTSLQFKRDVRDGQLYLLEINLRFPVWIDLPIACGLDFPYYYYQTCLSEPYEVPSDFRLGKKWMNVHRDFVSMKTYAREGTWTWRQWVSSLFARPVFSLFRWSDPLPFLVDISRWLAATTAARLRRAGFRIKDYAESQTSGGAAGKGFP